MLMKPYHYFLCAGIAGGLFSCAAKQQKTLADYYDATAPKKTELTATKHVRARNVRDNKQRVEYFNSIQHR